MSWVRAVLKWLVALSLSRGTALLLVTPLSRSGTLPTNETHSYQFGQSFRASQFHPFHLFLASMSIVLLDARSDSLCVSWPGTTLARCYILDYRTADSDWECLSENLRQTQVRKKNLDPEYEYFFRVAAVFDDGPGEWMLHDEGFYPLTEEEEEYAMAPPKVRKLEKECLVISWEHVEDAYAYELQMRENTGGAEWFTIADEVEAREVKKRHLKSKMGYMFRVRPLNGEYDEAFSPPSEVRVAVGAGKAQVSATVAPQTSEDYSMAAPWVKNAGPQALLVRWTSFNGATGYELQMRENKRKGTWTTIAGNLSGTEVKKKNLQSVDGYQFRVRPLGTREARYSAPSYGAIASQAPARNSRRYK